MSIIKIGCPSCGSNATFKLNANNYKCNYCQSEFIVKELDDTDNTMLSNISAVKTTPKSSNKLFLIIAIIISLVSTLVVAMLLIK